MKAQRNYICWLTYKQTSVGELTRIKIWNIMRKILFALLFALSYMTYAQEPVQSPEQTQHGQKDPQEVTIKAGTVVPLQVVNSVKAAQLNQGQTVAFRVTREINVKGVTAIPYGTMAYGTVYEAKKSSWFGTKGRLGLKINEILLPNGESIPLSNGDVYVTGKNRTTLSVLLFLFVTWPACFICGSKAELPYGYEVLTNVAMSTTVESN
jgi:hypothetical protein